MISIDDLMTINQKNYPVQSIRFINNGQFMVNPEKGKSAKYSLGEDINPLKRCYSKTFSGGYKFHTKTKDYSILIEKDTLYQIGCEFSFCHQQLQDIMDIVKYNKNLKRTDCEYLQKLARFVAFAETRRDSVVYLDDLTNDFSYVMDILREKIINFDQFKTIG